MKKLDIHSKINWKANYINGIKTGIYKYIPSAEIIKRANSPLFVFDVDLSFYNWNNYFTNSRNKAPLYN